MMKISKGFTLIELLVVVAIIGLLASVVFVSFAGVREDARDARRRADIVQLKTAMELCNADTTCGGAAGQYVVYASYTLADAGGIPTYIAAGNFPSDPSTGGDYAWTDNTLANTTFCVSADLETNGFVVADEAGVRDAASGCS